jgi:hypothetical protein
MLANRAELLRCRTKSALPSRCTWVSSFLWIPVLASRTPPEIKWLLVERATLAGDIEQLARRRTMLDAEMDKLRSRVLALDTSLRLLDARVNAAAAGKVLRHRQQYGERGTLKAFIVQTVRATERGLSMRTITGLVVGHFGLEFLSRAELARYCANSIRPQLRRLREEGLVENLPGAGPEGQLWRWKRGVPTLADLARLAGLPPSKAHDGDQDEA